MHNLRNSFCNNGYVYVKQQENNKIGQKIKRERERECSYASNYVVEFVIPTSFPFLVFVAFVVIVYT